MAQVAPGANTLSAAAAATTGPVCHLELAAGVYTQNEAVAIPAGVKHLVITGPGSGLTTLNWLSHASGICHATKSLANKLDSITLRGFTMTTDVGLQIQAPAIDLVGSSYNDTVSPGVTIDDVRITYGIYAVSWATGLQLTNARVGNITGLFVRLSPSGVATGTGIALHSCLNLKFARSWVMGCKTGLGLYKAADSLISGDIKHGCEDICVHQTSFYIVGTAILAGHKCAWTKVTDCELELCHDGAFVEQFPSPENGGYHRISGCYVGGTPSLVSKSLINLNRPGSIVTGNSFWTASSGVHNTVLLEVGATQCQVSQNVIRGLPAGASGVIILGDDNEVLDNVFEGLTAGAYALRVYNGGATNNLLRYRAGTPVLDHGSGTTHRT